MPARVVGTIKTEKLWKLKKFSHLTTQPSTFAKTTIKTAQEKAPLLTKVFNINAIITRPM